MQRLSLIALLLCLVINSALAQSVGLIWAKQQGGVNGEYSNDIAIDINGNIYTTGAFSGTADFDPGTGVHNLTSKGANDIFIFKLNASGNFIWAKSIGWGYGDVGRSITIDDSGNVYTTGSFEFTVDFDPGLDINNLSGYSTGAFVLKLDTNGTFIWAKKLGGDGHYYTYALAFGNSIAVDGNGNVYTTGDFYGPNDFNPGVGIDFFYPTRRDIFISKLDASGNYIWARQFKGATSLRESYGIAIVADAQGNVYTTGNFGGTVDFDPGESVYNLTSQNPDGGDLYISKLDANGHLLWAKSGKVSGTAQGQDICVDNQNNIIVTGSASSVSFDSIALKRNGAFIAKYNESGTVLWASSSTSGAGGQSVVSDADNNIYVAGYFYPASSWNDTTFFGNYGLVSSGEYDAFITKLDTKGTFKWVEKFGGPERDLGMSIAVDNKANIYTTGIFEGICNFGNKSSVSNLNSAGSYDAFVVKLREFPAPYQLTYCPAQSAIRPQSSQKIIGDPIQLGTGTYTYKHNDFSIPTVNGTLTFTRFYNSLNGTLIGPLGNGWSHTYNYSLENNQDVSWDIHYPDGHVSTFLPMNTSGQSFPIFSGTLDSLQKNSNNSFSLFTREKHQYHFDSTGKLDSIIDLNNNITNLHYTGSKLDSVVAPGGRSLVLTYSGNYIASVKDPLNRLCQYTYDANNNLITAKDPNNGVASFTYDTAHRMLTAINAINHIIVDNTYDSAGKIISQKDAYNQLTTIEYDMPNPGDATVTNPDNSKLTAHHDGYFRKTSEKDELGFIKSFTYDANSNETGFINENNQSQKRLFDNAGNLLSDTLPGGKITHITYNNFNSPTQLTDAKGNQKKFYYNNINNNNNNVDSIRYADSSLQIFSFNSKGQVVQSVDGNGNVNSYSYYNTGDLLSIKNFAGVSQFVYDAAGRKISKKDPKGRATNYVYDNNDNILAITDALGRTIQNTYDAINQLLSMKDQKGFVTTFAYDNKGRKIKSKNPKEGVTTYTYDIRDRLTSVTGPDNKVVSYGYDKVGRKTNVTNALGTTQYQYDGVGNLTKVIDPTGISTEYTYTTTNKKQSQKDGLNNTVQYDYDLNDNLTKATDPLIRITNYTYDVMNRLASVKDAAGKTTTVTYDKNGNKKTVVDPNGHTQTYSYDAVNRMITYQDAAANSYTYAYDSAGNNTLLTKPTGTIAKVFDGANRVITINNSTGDNYHFTYDNNDHVINMSNNAGTTSMAFDSLDQLIQYQDPFNKTVSFTYDVAGNKTSIVYPGNKTVLYAYDNANNLKSVTDWLSHTFSYTYDAAGRTTQLLYPNGARCNYAFDNAGRLISKSNSLSNNTIIAGSIFTLDAIGNRVAEQRTGQVPSVLTPSSKVYSYGADDRLLSDSIWSFTNDNSGNRTAETNGTKNATYAFSVDNLLNTWSDTASILTTNTYNPLGNRISKVVNASTNKYVLDLSSSLSQILQITDGNGQLKAHYVYGQGLLESIDAANSPTYYHFDAQHNTTALSDQNAIVSDTYTYDPFGSVLDHTGTSSQPFSFLGEYGVEQESSALFYARARLYDADNGRFISKDIYPADLNNPQTINRYVYATNNPISIFDFTGLYGQQDNISSKGLTAENFSSKEYANQLNQYNEWWGKQTSNHWYPIVSPAIPVLGDIDKISSIISVRKYVDDYKSNDVGLPETALRISMEFYSDAAQFAGATVAGPAGAYFAGVIASQSITTGKRLVNDTILGNELTDYLAAKYFTY